MNKEDIINSLKKKGPQTEAELSQIGPCTADRLHRMLYELVFEGKISFDGTKYTCIVGTHVELGKCVSKKNKFVFVNLVRENKIDVKLTGRASDDMLIGDYCYVICDFDRFGYNDARYFCPLQNITELKGNYKNDENGDGALSIGYLDLAGYQIRVKECVPEHVGIGDYVSATILARKPKLLEVRIDKVLVQAGNVGSDISQIIASHDAPMNFPEEVMDEAKAIPQALRPEDYADRKDLRDECIVTIDGDDSRDFDDAVSIEKKDYGWTIGVHIADVAYYVRPGHPLDNEAKNRGTSIYVADRVVPMLPFELSNGICSLNPDVDRLTITCRSDIDLRGNVIRSEVYPSVIRSHGRLTYNQVNHFFETGESDVFSDEIKKSLTELRACAAAIRARREKQGAMKLDSTELHFKLDENEFPVEVEIKTQDESEKMIEDMMVVANCEVAKLLHKLDIPTLYRVHENPPKEKLDLLIAYVKKLGMMSKFPNKENITPKALSDFLGQVDDEKLRKAMSIVMLRSMAKARYTPEPLGHFGLAEPDYLHFTSPIRRYPDTVVHRTLHEFVFNHKPFDKVSRHDYLESLGDDLSGDEKRAQAIERSVDDLESSKYMSTHIGEKFHGFIVSFIDFGMFIQLDNGIEGLLPFEYMSLDKYEYDDRTLTVRDVTPGNEHEYNLGDDIDVCVYSCNINNRRITFCSEAFFEELGRNLTPEQMEALKKNDITVTTEAEYLKNRHDEYRFSHRRPSKFGGAGRFDKKDGGKRDFHSDRGGFGHNGGSRFHSGSRGDFHKDRQDRPRWREERDWNQDKDFDKNQSRGGGSFGSNGGDDDPAVGE